MIAALITSLLLAAPTQTPAHTLAATPRSNATVRTADHNAALNTNPTFAPTTITLKRSATLKPNAPVTLADIATITGPLAGTLRSLEIAAKPGDFVPVTAGSRWRTVAGAHVRTALDAEPGLNLGRVLLKGDRVHVRTATAAARPTDGATTKTATAPIARAGTVHAHAVAVLTRTLDVPRQDLRITFDHKDRELLAVPTAGRTVEVRTLATSERTPLSISVYERDRIVASGTLTARVRIKRNVVVASAAIAPDEAITESLASTAVQWLAPDIRPAPPETVFGAVARSRLVPGSVVGIEDVTPPLAVRRGDRVQVHAIARGVVVRMPGRVRGDARPGETIEVKLLGRERMVTARVETDGRVVLLVDQVTPESSAAYAGPPAPGRRTAGASR